jgi:hypothetical protein
VVRVDAFLVLVMGCFMTLLVLLMFLRGRSTVYWEHLYNVNSRTYITEAGPTRQITLIIAGFSLTKETQSSLHEAPLSIAVY